MNFFRKLRTDPAPLPTPVPEPPSALSLALAEEVAAATAECEASALCARLDAEQKTWAQRRDRAYIQFCESLKRHAAAKAALAKLGAAAQEN